MANTEDENSAVDYDSVKLQDCNLIAQAFERGAAHEPTEAATFATMSRYLQNNITFSNNAKNILANYNLQSNTTNPTDQVGLKLNNQYIAVPDIANGSLMARAVKECIPCLDRVVGAFDLKLNFDLIKAFKEDIKGRLAMLKGLAALFNNTDAYGDYCHLLALLNSLCVPDLQRIVLILMALINALGGDIFKIGNFLINLIMPFFMPVLLTISSLLDQLVQLVLGPLDCIITSINLQIRKLDIGAVTGDQTLSSNVQELNKNAFEARNTVLGANRKVKSGLFALQGAMIEGSNLLRSKLAFYGTQFNKTVGLNNANSMQMLSLSSRKLTFIRLLALVRAMITAKGKGFKCEGSKPNQEEVNIFVNTFLNPYSRYNLGVDANGDLQVTLTPSNSNTTVTVKAEKEFVRANSTDITFGPVNQTVKCNLKTDSVDAATINRWIEELNKVKV